MRPSDIVRDIRTRSGLSVRALAAAAGVATSTIHRIEKGRLHPTVELLERIVEAGGSRLQVEPQLDYTASIVGLALSIREDLAQGDDMWPVRKAAAFASRFRSAPVETRRRMVVAEPPATHDERWDALLGGLVEWLTVQEGMPTPSWAYRPSRYLSDGWWVTPMKSMQAWEYAGSPASFKTRGVYLHRDSLTNV